MAHRIPAGLEELDAEEIDVRFPGLDLTAPCTAGEDDDGRIRVSCCHVLEQLSAWNRFLWHVGLQLRELRAPGELSLVRVVHMGSSGLQQEVRSRDARLLFHVLLVRHRCVVSVELDELICEGSGLGEYRERVVSALQQSTSLKALTFNSLFCGYRWIQDDMFRAIATMTNLHELVITGTGAAPLVLLEALCTLLLDTTSLTTLSMSGLVIDAAHRMRVVASLRHNVTIENLSLHGSIVHSYLSNGVSGFTVFLSNSTRLGSLSMEVVESDAAKTHMDLMCVIPPLVDRGTLWKLKLAGFLLNADCACLLAQLVSRKDGLLEHLDIGGCYWSAEESPPGSSRVEAGTTDWEEPDPAISKPICPWLQAFDDTARIELSFLALSFVGLQPGHLAALFNTATTFQYLATISLRDVALHELNEVCRIIRETDMSDRVRIEGEYLVDSAALSMLHEFPEGLRHVAVSSICEPRPEVFQNTVRLACSWYQVTTLHLFLTQNVVGDVVTIRSLSKYLGVAIPLRELALTGCYQPDLSLCLRGAGTSRTVLLEAIFENPGIQVLRIDGFRLGRANLCFLAYELVASETLCEVSFESPDRLENEAFVQLLAADVRENTTILRLQVLESVDGETQGERFAVEDVLGRNLGYLTCAAHFVVEEARLTRCAVAFATVSCSPALVEKVQKLAYVDGAEATNMIRRILE